MEIEIAYATIDEQLVIKQQVAAGCTVRDAIFQSKILEAFPHIVVGETKVGIFSRLVRWDTLLKPYDRIEIYRPLLLDPKEIRRLRLKS